MPWNITASIQGSRSRQGSSALIDFRGRGSVSDFSSRGLPGSAASNLKPWGGRLMSASPLAGRSGLPHLSVMTDNDRLNSLVLGSEDGNLDMDTLGDLDTSFQLENEREHDDQHAGGHGQLAKAKATAVASLNLDGESLNFVEFIKTQLEVRNAVNEDEDGDEGEDVKGKGKAAMRYIPNKNEIAFTSLLPPNKTNHKVATQGLMHVLTLATRGVLRVYQEEYDQEVRDGEDQSTSYCHGDIFLCLV